MGEYGDLGDNGEVAEIKEVSETPEETSEVDDEIDAQYNEYLEGDKAKEFEHKSAEKKEAERIKSRNENLEGEEHPETGVPFERREIEYKGKTIEVVAPKFESSYDAQLPEDMYEASDKKQEIECNSQLKKELSKNPETRDKFTEQELEQIENGDTPDGYTWHHDVEAGKVQLVDTETHQKTGHTGGRSIWGGGTENR